MRLLACAMLLALPACSSVHAEPAAAGGASAAGGGSSSEVQLGVPAGPDKLDFAPLSDGAELRLETFGQGGTHVLLGVRCIGFGSRAFVSIHALNLNSGTELVAPAPARPQLLFCNGDVCDLVPITMMMGGLTQPDEERNGLPIRVTAEVHNAAGVTGEAMRYAVLSTADL